MSCLKTRHCLDFLSLAERSFSLLAAVSSWNTLCYRTCYLNQLLLYLSLGRAVSAFFHSFFPFTRLQCLYSVQLKTTHAGAGHAVLLCHSCLLAGGWKLRALVARQVCSCRWLQLLCLVQLGSACVLLPTSKDVVQPHPGRGRFP